MPKLTGLQADLNNPMTAAQREASARQVTGGKVLRAIPGVNAVTEIIADVAKGDTSKGAEIAASRKNTLSQMRNLLGKPAKDTIKPRGSGNDAKSADYTSQAGSAQNKIELMPDSMFKKPASNKYSDATLTDIDTNYNPITVKGISRKDSTIREIPEGKLVGVRPNLNSDIADSSVPIPKLGPRQLQPLLSVQEGGKVKSTVYADKPFILLKPERKKGVVSFVVDQKERAKVASGQSKDRLMAVRGEYTKYSPKKFSIDDPNVVEIKFNPRNQHLAIRGDTNEAVSGSSGPVLVIADRIYAKKKDLIYARQRDAPKPEKGIKGIVPSSDVKFKLEKGGTTMKNNPPVGSFPSEVADDIPAMISEGEFMLPADVVRYHGLEKIRGLMSEAKMGLSCMEDDGLIIDVDAEGQPEENQGKEGSVFESVVIEKVDPMMKSMKLQEGGMPDEMSMPPGMDMPDEMSMPPMEESAPQEPPMEIPKINADLVQEFNGVPHILAYLNDEEVKALQSAGRGINEDGTPKLSPEGVPVFDESTGEQYDRDQAQAEEDRKNKPKEEKKTDLPSILANYANYYTDSIANSRLDDLLENFGAKYKANSGGYVTPMAMGGQMQDLFTGSGASKADEVLAGSKKKLNKGGGVLKLANGGGEDSGEADTSGNPVGSRDMTGGLQDHGPNIGSSGGRDFGGNLSGAGKTDVGDAVSSFKDYISGKLDFSNTERGVTNWGFGALAFAHPGFGLLKGAVDIAKAAGADMSYEGPGDESPGGPRRGPKTTSTRRVGEEFYGPGGDGQASNWLFKTGGKATPEDERDGYNTALRNSTGFQGEFGDGRFQDFVAADETGRLKNISDGLAGEFDKGVFQGKTEFVDIPMQGTINSQSGGRLAENSFAIKHVNAEGDVKFYAPNMTALTNAYRDENPDIANQGGNYTTGNDFRRHYKEFGKGEGRNFYKPEIFDFSNVGTPTQRLGQGDTTENPMNPYLNDVTDVFKDYTEGKFEHPVNAFKGGDVMPKEMNLADGGTALYFSKGGGTVNLDEGGEVYDRQQAAEEMAKNSDLESGLEKSSSESLMGTRPSDLVPSGQIGIGEMFESPSYENYVANVFGKGHLERFGKGKNFGSEKELRDAYNKNRGDYFNSTPTLEGQALDDRKMNSQYFSSDTFRDQELGTIFDHFNVSEKEDRDRLLGAYKGGATNLVNYGSLGMNTDALTNDQMTTALNQLSNSRRIQDKGVTDSDLFPYIDTIVDVAGPGLFPGPDGTGGINRKMQSSSMMDYGPSGSGVGLTVEDFMGGVINPHGMAATDGLWTGRKASHDLSANYDYIQQTGADRLPGIMRDHRTAEPHQERFDYSLDERPNAAKMNTLMPRMTSNYNYGQRYTPEESGEGN